MAVPGSPPDVLPADTTHASGWPVTGAAVFDGLMALLGQEPHDGPVVEAATSMALGAGAWRAWLPLPLPRRVPCPWGVLPEDALAQDHEARRADAEAHLGMLRRSLARMQARSICSTGECTDARLESTVVQRARLAGLIVTGVPPEVDGEMPLAARWFARVLTETGRPLLVVPRHASLSKPPMRALVAWSDTPASTRALHDALRWLPPSCTLRIVTVLSAPSSQTAASAEALSAHVKRHRRVVHVDLLDASNRPPEDVLLEEAFRMGAEVIVMGAYGHRRGLELIVGGTTLTMLHRSRLPLFMAH